MTIANTRLRQNDHMKKVRGFFLGLIVSVAVQGFAADALTEALQKGLFEEEANQNLEAAIKAYQDVLGRAEEQRRIAATALFRLAECYRKQGKTNEASAEYRRLVRDYSEQATLVNLSRQNLVGLGVGTTAASASPTQNADPLTTDEEQQEIQRIRSLIKNSPDLINAKNRTFTPVGLGNITGTVLHEAAFKGHLLVAEYLLANGGDVNATDSYQSTPLYHAARSGHKRVVELLLSKGANPSLGAYLPLHAAAERGFIGVAEVLHANKADVNAVRQGKTALHMAIQERNFPIAELLLKNGADVNVVYTREWKGGFGNPQQGNPLYHLANLDGTALHFAIQGQNIEAARMLLAKNADANARSGAGLTPLHYIVNPQLNPDSSTRLAEMLFEAGAKVDALGSDDGNLPGWTPLHIAVFHKNANLVALLLEKGADPNLPVAPSGNEGTALNMAISGGGAELVELLLKHKADVNARDRNGNTPLVRAMRERNERLVDLLLSKGADPNALDAYGFPPLHVALGAQPPAQPGLGFNPIPHSVGQLVVQNQPVVQGYGGVSVAQPFARPGVPSKQTSEEQRMVDLLLKHKADPNLRDKVKEKESETALHLAARYANEAAVELLLKYKADPNARTESGTTPLHLAVQTTRAEGIVDLLLAHNADVKAAKKDGDTALHSAAAQGLTNVVVKLVQKGADINTCGDNGQTPLHRTLRAPVAHQSHQLATVEFMLKRGADMLKRCDNHLSAFEEAVLREKQAPPGASWLVDLFRKHYPKKLAAATFDGEVVRPVWFWEADKPVTLSEAIEAVGLKDTADLTRVTIMRNNPDTGVRGERHNLALIREKQTSDVPLKHGDKITVAVRAD